MNFIDTVKAFFNGPKVDPAAVAALNAVSAASDAYNPAFDAIVTFTERANHRYAIWAAKRALYNAPSDRYDEERQVYDETVAGCSPADFEPYTEAYLDAHTTAIETLSAAFDNFTAAFAALNPADDLYAVSAALYKAICDTYTLAATAYSRAAGCALSTALKGNLQAIEDGWNACLLEDRANRSSETNPVAAKAKAAEAKAKAAEDATKSKVLEQKARVAETKAKVFLAKAESAEARALKTSQ